MNDKLVTFPGPGRKAAAKRKKCPICGRPTLADADPFCSKRCADEDLRRWLTGEYRIPTKEPLDPDGEDGGGSEPSQ